MKITGIKAFIAILCALFTLSGCASGGSDTKDLTGMTLFEALSEENSEKYSDFVKEFDEKNFTSLDYYAGGGAFFHTDNPTLIKEVYDVLGKTTLKSRYNGGEATSDAEESLIFIGKDGSEVSFGFDARRASVGGGMYYCSNESELKSVTEKIKDRRITAGLSVIEAYAFTYGEPYMALLDGFVPDLYEKAFYNIYGEGLEKYSTTDSGLIEELYNALSKVTIAELYDGPQATDRGEAFGFIDKAGNEFFFNFDIGCLCLRDELYNVDGKKALDSFKSKITEE